MESICDIVLYKLKVNTIFVFFFCAEYKNEMKWNHICILISHPFTAISYRYCYCYFIFQIFMIVRFEQKNTPSQFDQEQNNNNNKKKKTNTGTFNLQPVAVHFFLYVFCAGKTNNITILWTILHECLFIFGCEIFFFLFLFIRIELCLSQSSFLQHVSYLKKKNKTSDQLFSLTRAQSSAMVQFRCLLIHRPKRTINLNWYLL